VGFNRRFEVEISGVGEHVIAVREKHEGDDEDNDGAEDDGEREDEDDRGDGDDDDDEEHNRDNGVFWKIYLINSFEAVVKFIVKEEPLTLIEIEGERGPFDYQVEPGMDLLTYSEVREKVLREAEGHIDQWELEMDHHEDDLIWVYNFDVVGDAVKYKIVINAFTGEFLLFEVHD